MKKRELRVTHEQVHAARIKDARPKMADPIHVLSASLALIGETLRKNGHSQHRSSHFRKRIGDFCVLYDPDNRLTEEKIQSLGL